MSTKILIMVILCLQIEQGLFFGKGFFPDFNPFFPLPFYQPVFPNNQQVYQQPAALALVLECANDTCVPQAVKANIRAGWSNESARIFDQCSTTFGNGQCTTANAETVGQCILPRIQQATDPTQVTYDYSASYVINCCGNQVTLSSLQCAYPKGVAQKFV